MSWGGAEGRRQESEFDETKTTSKRSHEQSRRRFLSAGLTATCGLAASLAGCNIRNDPAYGDEDDGSNWTPSNPNSTPNRNEGRRELENPAAYFEDAAHENIYSNHSLPDYEVIGWNVAADGFASYNHPDSRSVRTQVVGDIARVSFTGIVTHEFNLVLNFTSPAWDDDGTHSRFHSDNPHVVEHRVEPTVDFSENDDPEDFAFERHRIDVDVSHLDFPRNVSFDTHALIEDPRISDADDTTRYFALLNHQRTLAIPHRNGVEWANDGTLAPTSINIDGKRQSVGARDIHRQKDFDNHRLTYACIQHAEGAIGVGVTTDKSEMASYRNSGQKGYFHVFEEVERAPQKPAMRKLAQDLWDAQTALGITDILDRCRSAAKFAQSFPYEVSGSDDGSKIFKPLYCIHDHNGNCTEKTAIYGGILRCDPFDIRVSAISCHLVGQGDHLVGGIDANHLDASDHDTGGLYMLSTSNYPKRSGHPSGDYAFIDLTDRSNDVGEFDSDYYDIEAFWFTNRGEGI